MFMLMLMLTLSGCSNTEYVKTPLPAPHYFSQCSSVALKERRFTKCFTSDMVQMIQVMRKLEVARKINSR